MKTLLDTFLNLRLRESLGKDLLTTTEVLKISRSSSDNFVYIYLRFKRLVDENTIKELEREIESQFFASYGYRVKIEDTYDLPDYSVSDVLNLVWSRFVSKMAEDHPSCKGALQRAKWTVDEESQIHVTIDGYSMIESLSEAWGKSIRETLLNRFQLQSSVSFDFTQPKKHIFTYSDPVERSIPVVADARTASVSDTSSEVPFDETNSSVTASVAPKTAETTTSKQTSQKKTPLRSGNGFKSGRPGTVKASFNEKAQNPNVIYGRSFTDESHELSYYGQLEGQMVIRCEILAVETTEIKNKEKVILKVDVTDYTDSITCKIFVETSELS